MRYYLKPIILINIFSSGKHITNTSISKSNTEDSLDSEKLDDATFPYQAVLIEV